MGAATRKAVFVDVDGTLIGAGGRMPDSAREAIRAARRNGHLVFLATGRPLSQLWDELHELGFDGAITGAGAHVEVGGEELASSLMTPDQVTRVVDYLDAHGIQYVLESSHGVIGSAGIGELLRAQLAAPRSDQEELAELEAGHGQFLASITIGADPHSLPVHKIGFYDAPCSLEEIRDAFDGEFDIVPNSVVSFPGPSGDLAPAGIHKAIGLDLIGTHLGIAQEDTIAIGDSRNDLEMIQHAGIGIAMAGSPQEVLDAADAVTGSPEQDGIRDAFLRFGLIDEDPAQA